MGFSSFGSNPDKNRLVGFLACPRKCGFGQADRHSEGPFRGVGLREHIQDDSYYKLGLKGESCWLSDTSALYTSYVDGKPLGRIGEELWEMPEQLDGREEFKNFKLLPWEFGGSVGSTVTTESFVSLRLFEWSPPAAQKARREEFPLFTITVQSQHEEPRTLSWDPALQPELMIGRFPSHDIPLVRGSVSHYHAALCFEEGEIVVYDLRSTNGVYVNGEQVTSLERGRKGLHIRYQRKANASQAIQAGVQGQREGDTIYISDFTLNIEYVEQEFIPSSLEEWSLHLRSNPSLGNLQKMLVSGEVPRTLLERWTQRCAVRAMFWSEQVRQKGLVLPFAQEFGEETPWWPSGAQLSPEVFEGDEAIYYEPLLRHLMHRPWQLGQRLCRGEVEEAFWLELSALEKQKLPEATLMGLAVAYALEVQEVALRVAVQAQRLLALEVRPRGWIAPYFGKKQLETMQDDTQSAEIRWQCGCLLDLIENQDEKRKQLQDHQQDLEAVLFE